MKACYYVFGKAVEILLASSAGINSAGSIGWTGIGIVHQIRYEPLSEESIVKYYDL